MLYDNTTLAVARILGNGELRRTPALAHLHRNARSGDRFGRPGKGKVKALAKTARRKAPTRRA